MKIVTNKEERAEAVRRLAELGSQRISHNFLAAHGLEISNGWSSLTPKNAQVIVKLDEVSEEIGIKSP